MGEEKDKQKAGAPKNDVKEARSDKEGKKAQDAQQKGAPEKGPAKKAGGSKDFTRVIKMIWSEKSGAYKFKDAIVHKEKVDAFLK